MYNYLPLIFIYLVYLYLRCPLHYRGYLLSDIGNTYIRLRSHNTCSNRFGGGPSGVDGGGGSDGVGSDGGDGGGGCMVVMVVMMVVVLAVW